jgi:phenylpropionate dioxygenase-like ring-hydroxylating dioxygenase large terminal subunit
MMPAEYWYIACESRELKGRPLARTVLGKRLALFRDANGRASAVLDSCPHRNMALTGGKVTAQGLQCPYHGWTWDGEGRCAHLPAACGADAENAQALRVRAFPVAEKQGLIWVFVGEGVGEGAAAGSLSAPLDFPMFAAQGWNHWFMQRTFAGNVFNCVENFLDCPHTVFVHKHLFRSPSWRESRCRVTAGSDWVQAEFLDEKPLTTAIGRLLFPQRAAMAHTDRFMLPAVTRVDYRFSEARHFIIMSQCTPVSETETRVFTYMAFRFDPIAPLVRLLYQPYARLVLDQDVRIIARQAENLAAHGGARFTFHPTDAIAREIRDLMDGKSPAGTPEYVKRLRF